MEKIKNVLQKYFDASYSFESPLQEDLMRRVDHDQDGNEIVSFVPFDGPSLIKSNGNFLAWSLNSLMAAGVNPNFSISTGYNTRLEGIGAIVDAAAEINAMLDEVSSSSDSPSKE